jgi:hypothetical protein
MSALFCLMAGCVLIPAGLTTARVTRCPPATPLSDDLQDPQTGSFAPPPRDGFALARKHYTKRFFLMQSVGKSIHKAEYDKRRTMRKQRLD